MNEMGENGGEEFSKLISISAECEALQHKQK